MTQLNLHVSPEFEADLARFRDLRGIRSKSEAVRIAVREALERELATSATVDFHDWIGLAAAAPQNPRPRFRTEDDLWGEPKGR